MFEGKNEEQKRLVARARKKVTRSRQAMVKEGLKQIWELLEQHENAQKVSLSYTEANTLSKESHPE